MTMNIEQKYAYDLVGKKNIFITGEAGSGKTFLLNKIIEKCKTIYNKKNIGITSLSGISSILIKGTTLHSYLGIGLGTLPEKKLIDKILKRGNFLNIWKNMSILIIDEISLLTEELFDKLDNIAKIIRKNNRPFGDIKLILSGDFLQLPCINGKFCFESKKWDEIVDEVIYLNYNKRQSKDLEFQKCLKNIRIGNITNSVKKTLNKCIDRKIDNKYGIKPTKLYSTKIEVEKYNNDELDSLASENNEFYQYDRQIIRNNINIFEKTIINSCPLPESLQLCKGAQVMLICNLDIKSGLANGSRGIITGFDIDNYPIVKFMSGLEISIIPYQIEYNELVLDMKSPSIIIRQIPLIVSFACTYHKTQGITLEYGEIDLSNIFEYGQAYVALSRIKSLESLVIKNRIPYHKIKAHPKALKFYNKLNTNDNKMISFSMACNKKTGTLFDLKLFDKNLLIMINEYL